MDRRLTGLVCVFYLLMIKRTDAKLVVKFSEDEENVTMECAGGTFEDSYEKSVKLRTADGISESRTCKAESCSDNFCKKLQVHVKYLSSVNLIQLDLSTAIAVLVSDVFATVLIGMAVYSVCSQSRIKSGSTSSTGASQQVNPVSSAVGDTYQRLHTRSDEYSALHAPRRHRGALNP